MSNSDTVGLIEAADILKVHPKTAEDMARDGTIPAGKIGRAYVFMRRDVVRFAEQAINKQTADRILKRSPKRVRKVRSTQVRVAH
ncbi:MAG: helix-turn-helix domain-containing protein [Delftia acidovorans]|jgi:excisionase family DNA binding protein|nr:helix-turn-helix domain-containing protein [Delftia acidovorans]